MSTPSLARRLVRYAAVWGALAVWALACARLGVPAAAGWIAPCAVAAGTLAVLAAAVTCRGRR